MTSRGHVTAVVKLKYHGTDTGTPRRLPREDPCAEVGEEVRVGVGVGVRVGPVEFKLNATAAQSYEKSKQTF